MNLVIDIGNTRVKAALFEQSELKHSYIFETTDLLLFADLFEKHSVKQCIVCSVVDEIEPFINRLKEKTKTFLFTSETPIPILNLYRPPQSLGPDRIAACIGGNFLFPNKNILVIDTGTCIKYNFVNSNNEYIGGAISPGLQMRFKALHTFTSRLPLLVPDENFNTLIGKNSNDSILSGVEMGATEEMQGFITQYEQLYPGINVMLTGGDANFFVKRLKNRIFADSFLILKGLNVILNYQCQ